MAGLADEFTSAGAVDDARRVKASHPSGWEPGVVWNGNDGTITTDPLTEQPRDFDALLRVWDLDPASYEVVEPVQYRAWDAAIGGGNVRRMYYYKCSVRRRNATVNVDELVAAVGRHRPRKPASSKTGGVAFVVATGDTQIGKGEGDGTDGTIGRFLNSLDASTDRLKQLRRKHDIDTIYLPWLGDCIEGFNSQGGRLAWRNDLTLTEQVRVYRRLLLKQIEAFAPLAEKVVVPVVPGNHDEAVRTGDKMSTRFDDSWAVEGAVAVSDALALNPAAFGHVSVVVPGRDELTLTLDVAGTIVGFAHGHQFGRDVDKWWAGQAHGMQPIGDATLLMAGHLHHLVVREQGPKTFVQTPASDPGSQWFKHRTGAASRTGVVTMLVGGGGWSDLAVL